MARTCTRNPPSSSRIHPHREDAPHLLVPWGCPATIHVVGMSRGMPHIQLCHGDALCLSVPWGCPVSISAVRMPHVHLCCGFSPCPSLPRGCPTSIRTMGLLRVHLHHRIAQRPSMPRRRLTRFACCHRTQGDKPFLCLLPALVRMSWARALSPVLEPSGCSLAGETPVWSLVREDGG